MGKDVTVAGTCQTTSLAHLHTQQPLLVHPGIELSLARLKYTAYMFAMVGFVWEHCRFRFVSSL